METELEKRQREHDEAKRHPTDLLNIQETADYLGVPVTTIRYWRHQNEGPPSAKIGRHLRYRFSDVQAWLDAKFAA